MRETNLQITHGLFDHMVLQRGGATSIRGLCRSTGVVRLVIRRGKRIVRTAMVARIRDGKFTGKFPKIPAGGPYDFELSVASERLVVRDVLVGDVWLLGGQSNMQGGGLLADAAKPDSQVRAFYMDDRWATARDPIHNMWQCVDQVHIDLCGGARPQKNTAGTGPGVAFGVEMRRRTGIPQGLIACAHGGTGMGLWNPALKKDGSRSLYGALVRRVQKNGGRVAGLVWYQGEAEWYAEAVAAYTANMRALVRALRRDTHDARLPVAIVQLARRVDAPASDAPIRNRIQDQQHRLEKVIGRLTCVPAIDLTMSDPNHLNGRSANRLGCRLATAMDDLCHGCESLTLSRISVRSDKSQWKCRVIVQFKNMAGRLRAEGRPSGFSILTPEMIETVYDTQLDGDRVVLFTQSSAREARARTLSYGAGMNPYCNITDEADRALPVFGPVDIGRKRVLTPFVRSWRMGRIATDPVKLTQPPVLNGTRWERLNFLADFADCHEIVSGLREGGLLFAVDCNCSEPMRLRAHLGYDGPITVWCDGQPVFRDPKGTNPARVDEGMSRQWQSTGGRHELLIYLGANAGKAWGVFLRLERVDASPKTQPVILPVFA